MINDWKVFLAEKGFEKFDRKGFIRTGNPISTMITEIGPQVRHREVRVRLNLEIHDPFLEEEKGYYVFHFSGDVTPQEITVTSHHSPTFDRSPRWLAPDQKEAVLAVLQHCMEPWFAYWRQPRQLIEYFLNPPDLVITRATPAGEVEHVATVRQALHLGRGLPRGKLPPASLENLSLLYYHVGDRRNALKYSRLYLEVPRGTIQPQGEPERTLRQIKALLSPS